MTILLITHWLTVAAVLVLGAMVFATNSARLVNQAFLALALHLASWLVLVGIAFTTTVSKRSSGLVGLV